MGEWVEAKVGSETWARMWAMDLDKKKGMGHSRPLINKSGVKWFGLDGQQILLGWVRERQLGGKIGPN